MEFMMLWLETSTLVIIQSILIEINQENMGLQMRMMVYY